MLDAAWLAPDKTDLSGIAFRTCATFEGATAGFVTRCTPSFSGPLSRTRSVGIHVPRSFTGPMRRPRLLGGHPRGELVERGVPAALGVSASRGGVGPVGEVQTSFGAVVV